MNALLCQGYGKPDVITLGNCPIPKPKAHELQIRVQATTVSAADSRIRRQHMPRGFGVLARGVFGLRRPRQPILGGEFSGVVEAVGKNVSHFARGDRVFGMTGLRLGCHAEYLCIDEQGALARVPPGVDMESAAALSFGGTAALYFLRQGKLNAGERILINGAAGSVGSAAVQLARHLGAQVTAVCRQENHMLVSSLGADILIDYSTRPVFSTANRYDMILDCIGNLSIRDCLTALTDSGRLALVSASLPQLLEGAWRCCGSKRSLVWGSAPERAEDIAQLARLAQEGHFTPVISQRFYFDQAAAAHACADTGHKQGNLLLLPGGRVKTPC